MKTIYRPNSKSNTRVDIQLTSSGIYRGMMKQEYKNETDVLAVKEMRTLNGITKWANKVLA